MSEKSLREKFEHCYLNRYRGEKFIDYNEYPIELMSQMFHDGYNLSVEEMEQRLKEADFIVKKISDYCFDEPDTYFACTFCDMGDSGHSSKGKGYHDDYCLAKIAKAYLEKWK